MPYKYIGRTTSFKGKSLWEIVGNLKNYGVGRIVTRSVFERYPEPSYMKILKVEASPNPKNPSIDNVRRVKVIVERTFRGKKLPEPVHVNIASYKTDYRLIPKEEEEEYCRDNVQKPIILLPKYTEFPPLLKELIIRESKSSGQPVENPKMEIVYRTDDRKYKVAEDGETAHLEIDAGLGKPVSPNLYKGLQL